MNHRTPSFARVLLLLVAVAVGPLQAQTVFACAMMGTVMHDECCCDDHEATQGCTDSSCGAVLESSESPCCEQSVEIGIDDPASQENPIVKPVEVRSDGDPPQALISSCGADFIPPAVTATRRFDSASPADPGGSETYLVTQRLRI